MRDNPIHSFIQIMTGQNHDQLAWGSYSWVAVAIAWILLLGGLGIAIYSWKNDPAQRTLHHLSIFIMRFVTAGLWYVGMLWKFPWPVSHGFKEWLTNCVTFNSFQWLADIMQVFLNHITIVQPLVAMLEIAIAFSLAFGFATRLGAIIGALFIFNLLVGLYNDPTEWVWNYVGIVAAHGMFAAASAGKSLGLDHVLSRRAVFARGSGLAQLHQLVS
jgi:hypothetical protein